MRPHSYTYIVALMHTVFQSTDKSINDALIDSFNHAFMFLSISFSSRIPFHPIPLHLSFIHSFIHSSIRSFIRDYFKFILSFKLIHSDMHPSIHQSTHPSSHAHLHAHLHLVQREFDLNSPGMPRESLLICYIGSPPAVPCMVVQW